MFLNTEDLSKSANPFSLARTVDTHSSWCDRMCRLLAAFAVFMFAHAFTHPVAYQNALIGS